MKEKKSNRIWSIRPPGRDIVPYSFGITSQKRLAGCHHDIQKVCNYLIQHYNITIIEGWRGERRQRELFKNGDSQVDWPKSKHNRTDKDGNPESRAVDMAIWHPEKPHIHWNDAASQMHFAGIVLGAGLVLGIPLRAGCDWDENLNVLDNWQDCWHFEMKK